MVAMMPSRSRRTDETMAMLTLEYLFVRVAMFGRVTWLRILLFTQTYYSPV
jgi:hypothetical protein